MATLIEILTNIVVVLGLGILGVILAVVFMVLLAILTAVVRYELKGDKDE